jgi:hypothetical protein
MDNGELKTLFEASDTLSDRLSFVNWYNHYSGSLTSGLLFGYENEEIILFNNYDTPTSPLSIIRSNLIDT